MAQEVLLQPVALPARQVGDVENDDAGAGQLLAQRPPPLLLRGDQDRDPLADALELLGRPSGRPPKSRRRPVSTCPTRPATRTMKNSSRLLAEIDRNRSRSSSGWFGLAASSSTRRLNSSHDSSRLMKRSSDDMSGEGFASFRQSLGRLQFQRRRRNASRHGCLQVQANSQSLNEYDWESMRHAAPSFSAGRRVWRADWRGGVSPPGRAPGRTPVLGEATGRPDAAPPRLMRATRARPRRAPADRSGAPRRARGRRAGRRRRRAARARAPGRRSARRRGPR